MSPEQRTEYVKYRLEIAYKTLDAARVLANENFWNSCVNRLYYSAFYAVSALLVANQIEAKTHSGIRNQFSKLFIKSKKLDIKYGALFSQLFDWRQKGDYGNIYDFKSQDVLPLFEQVLELIKATEKESNKI